MVVHPCCMAKFLTNVQKILDPPLKLTQLKHYKAAIKTLPYKAVPVFLLLFKVGEETSYYTRSSMVMKRRSFVRIDLYTIAHEY